MEEGVGATYFSKSLELPETPKRGKNNVIEAVINRQIDRFKGLIPPQFQRAAEDKLIEKQVLEEMTCSLPDSPRSTFLMVFSPDGKKVASTHGNHNIYVTDLTTGKNIQTLTGHPRTPWCIAFHPSSNQILASGCLGGQVRVWDLTGGSEIWNAESATVIASLAFHPIDRMLVIATYNELHFWDWSQPEPFAKCSTKTEREKVRYVTFDRLGHKLITGIANQVAVQSQWDRVSTHVADSTTSTATTSSTSGTPPVAATAPSSERERSIAFCYRNLMNQYNQLVRRYFDLSRSRLTPTMDRGTDPMDVMDVQNVPGTSGTSAASTAPAPANDPDAESTSSGSGSEDTTLAPSSTPVTCPPSIRAPPPQRVFPTTQAGRAGSSATASTSSSGSSYNPFLIVTRAENTTPSYPWTPGTTTVAPDSTTPESGPYSTDLLRALLRDVASSESQSSEDTELEMATRSDSPRAVVSRADSDHHRPVPTFQLRPRLLQDPSYQLRFLTNRETFGSISSAPPSSRRMLLRPGGQFVLSRHSNSPFQPRVPLRMDGPPVTRPPSTPPAIPSQASSFSPARRLLYDQVRVFLCDRIRSATEATSADTTTNYSHLAREPDADTGPDISWDSDSETLIIRPRGSSSRTPRPSEESDSTNRSPPSEPPLNETRTEPSPQEPSNLNNGNNITVGTDVESSSTTQQTSSSSQPYSANIGLLTSHMERMRRLLGARVEDPSASLVNLQSGVQQLLDELIDNAEASVAPGTSQETYPRREENGSIDDGSFERHLRGQVRRLRAAVQELRGGIEGVVRSRDVSSLLQSTSLDDPPSPVAPTRTTSSTSGSSNTDFQALLTALASDMMRSPENWQQQPGPSSRAGDWPPADEAHRKRLINRLKAVFLRRLEEEPQFRTIPSEPLLMPFVRSPPVPPRGSATRMPRLSVRLKRLSLPSRRPLSGAEETLRADGFHRDQLSGWRTVAARISSHEDRRYHRNKLRASSRNRDRDQEACVKLTLRALLRGRAAMNMKALLDRGIIGINPQGIRRRPVAEGSRQGSSAGSESVERPPSSSTSSSQDTCRSCGLRQQSGSSLKRKGANPQKFRADKFSRDATGQRRTTEANSTQMLLNMIDQMQSIVEMQEESPTTTPSMTAEERDLLREIDEEVRLLGLPIRLRSTPALLHNLSRNIARLRAHQLLNAMMHSVSTFFETHSTTMVELEIRRLYNLLQIALELTDLLLRQFQTSRNLNVPAPPEQRTRPSNVADIIPENAAELDSVVPEMVANERSFESVTSTGTETGSAPNTPAHSSPPQTAPTARGCDDHAYSSPADPSGRRVPWTSVPFVPPFYSSRNGATSTPGRTSQSVDRSGPLPGPSGLSNRSPRAGDPAPSSPWARSYSICRIFPVRFTSRDNSSSTSLSPLTESSPSRHHSPAGQEINRNSSSSSVESPAPQWVESPNLLDSQASGSQRAEEVFNHVPNYMTEMRRCLRRNYGRSFERLMDAHRRRMVAAPHGQPTPEGLEVLDVPRSGRSAALHRHRRPRLWPSARMSSNHMVGCLRRQRHVRFNSRVYVAPEGQNNSRNGRSNQPASTSLSGPSSQVPGGSPRDHLDRASNPEPLRAYSPRDPPWPTTTENLVPVPVPDGGFTVPLVRVNDIPVSDINTLPSTRSRAPPLPLHEEMSRWRFYRPRFLHPRYYGPNPFDEQEGDNADQSPQFYRMLNASSGHSTSIYTLDPIMITEAPVSPHHRIQAWDFSRHVIPDISDRELNGVVAECKIHNDASVDVSSDGQLLVTLLPSGRLSITTMLGIYSLEWGTLGQLLYKTGFDQNAVSVSLSPTSRHLLVGLASRPLSLRDRDRTNMAQIFRLGGALAMPGRSWHSGRGVLHLVRDLEQTREMNVMSLNCIRWAPGPGYGLVYGTNTGQLKILR